MLKLLFSILLNGLKVGMHALYFSDFTSEFLALSSSNISPKRREKRPSLHCSIGSNLWETSEWPSELNFTFKVQPLAMRDKSLILAVQSLLLTKVTLLFFELNISVFCSALQSKEF